ncbi:MAG: hypothetical protein WC993_03920 [Methanoculleus sp.]
MLTSPSAYFMEHPPMQVRDDDACRMTRVLARDVQGPPWDRVTR